jgi:hypothetical protein
VLDSTKAKPSAFAVLIETVKASAVATLDEAIARLSRLQLSHDLGLVRLQKLALLHSQCTGWSDLETIAIKSHVKSSVFDFG